MIPKVVSEKRFSFCQIDVEFSSGFAKYYVRLEVRPNTLALAEQCFFSLVCCILKGLRGPVCQLYSIVNLLHPLCIPFFLGAF